MSDDVNDLLDDGRAELEARFRELEHEAEIDRLRQQSGAAPRRPPAPEPAASSQPEGGPAHRADDPLAGMKAALDGEGELERYLMVLCPGCGAQNRMSLRRVRTARAICGRCKADLSFTRY